MDTGDMALAALHSGRCATIMHTVNGDGDSDRLAAMGICSGRHVILMQRGDPLIVRVLGSRIGVSARLAERIRVQPCRDGACNRMSRG